MPERTLTVRIIGDDRSLSQAFKRGEKSGKGFKVGVAGIGAGIARDLVPAAAAVFSVQKAFRFLGDSVSEASALNEEVNKSEEIFGSSSEAVVKWSSTLAASFGISQVAALQATGTIGNLLHTVGLAPAESAKMSQSLVELAADLASFNNATPEDVLAAIQSGLVGQARPLRRYGVLIDAATVAQRAMADTGKRTTSQLTNQEKVLARYELILSQTTKAQGDVARTAGGLANQQRFLAANIKNLEAQIGAGLLPALLHLTIAANDAFFALNKLGTVHVPIIGNPSIGKLLGLAGWTELNFLIDQVHKGLHKVNTESGQLDLSKLQPGQLPGLDVVPGFPVLPPTPEPKKKAPPDPFGPLKEADALRRKQALAAGRAHRAAERAFNAVVAGLGLKIDKAAITAGLGDDLSAMRELEAAILRRIAVEGKTFKLVSQLVAVRATIASTLEQQVADSKQKTEDAFDNALDALNLNLEIAKATRGFNDDLRALRAIEAQILKRISAEGRTTDLLRQLFENRQAQAETILDARRASQFEALGLTAEGDKPIASSGSLLKRARSLQQQIKGTVLDTAKTRRQLSQIVKVLTDSTKKAGRDVRSAILSMLDEISKALDPSGSTGDGQLTKFGKRGVNKLIQGLGLDPEQIKEIRQRFSQFGRLDFEDGGRRSRPRAPGRTARPIPGDHGPAEPDGRVVVNVYIDGQRVEGVVTRRQQKKRGRNAPQRRGVNPGARR